MTYLGSAYLLCMITWRLVGKLYVMLIEMYWLRSSVCIIITVNEMIEVFSYNILWHNYMRVILDKF